MLMSVSTNALPRAGMTVSFAAYRSYPAAKADPRVGSRALSDSFLMRREGICSILAVRAAGLGVAVGTVLSVFNLFAGGDTGGEVADWAVIVYVRACSVLVGQALGSSDATGLDATSYESLPISQ